MRAHVSDLATAIARKQEVAVADCVHFCGYRYGCGEINPYEQYAKGLAEGLPLHVVRSRFVDYVRSYRPRDLGEALGARLSRSYPLWHLPWRTPDQVRRFPGWVATAASVVDVMTYFADEGIPGHVLEKEFGWHERAFSAISAQGYQPQRHSYILARELRGERSTYLVTDGNHRLSAISALGGISIVLKLPVRTTVVRANVERWPLVRAGMVACDDALAIFDAYLSGNATPARADQPAEVIVREAGRA